MKPQNRFFKGFFLFLVIVTLTISCEKDKEKTNFKYLADYELLYSYTPEQVQSIIIVASIIFPEVDTLLSTSAFGVEIYKVSYKTTFKGENIIASGIISVPKQGDNFPMLSFQNGTNTCNENAPSENIDNQLFKLISIVAGNGYIVTIPDYIGFGESKEVLHPYHHRESSNRAIIDLILAARELLDTKAVIAATNGNLFLMGYSQGGWATLSVLHELEHNPVEDLTPVAASVGAGAYDMYKMGNYIVNIDEYPNPFYLPYFVQSHIANGFMEGPLTNYFKEPYASTIPGLFDGSRCNTEMNEEFPITMVDLLTSELVLNYETGSEFEPLRQELSNNSVPAWNVQVPIFIYHSKGDKSVPYFESEDLYNNLLNEGVSSDNLTLQLINDSNLDHGDAVVPWGIESFSWFGSMK